MVFNIKFMIRAQFLCRIKDCLANGLARSWKDELVVTVSCSVTNCPFKISFLLVQGPSKRLSGPKINRGSVFGCIFVKFCTENL